jgi:hypothetical protein
MTRDRVKTADAAAASGRFHLMPNVRNKLDGKPGEGRRTRRDGREAKKGP